jgi:hypothetical protein
MADGKIRGQQRPFYQFGSTLLILEYLILWKRAYVGCWEAPGHVAEGILCAASCDVLLVV